MKIRLLYFVLLFTLVNGLMAQNFPNKAAGNTGPATILATYIDLKTNKPVEYVTVSLIRAADSTIVNGTTTTKKGEIRLENIAFGTYKLKASFIGYKTL